MRSFLALTLPDPVRAALLRAQGTLPTGRPVPEENLHLTLAFLGDVPDAVLEEIDVVLSSTRLAAPCISFGGLGTFAEMEQGLVFAEVLADDTLVHLQAKVTRIARAAGADLPRRRFRPHVTLMRANRQPKGPARDRLATTLGLRPDIPGFTATRLALYQSRLGPRGAQHTILADYALG
jgi:2'-5' RNA ligase